MLGGRVYYIDKLKCVNLSFGTEPGEAASSRGRTSNPPYRRPSVSVRIASRTAAPWLPISDSRQIGARGPGLIAPIKMANEEFPRAIPR